MITYSTIHGRRKGGAGGPRPPWNLKFDIFPSNVSKKGRFLNFEWVKSNSATFGSPWKNIFGYAWKNPFCPALGKILPTPMVLYHSKFFLKHSHEIFLNRCRRPDQLFVFLTGESPGRTQFHTGRKINLSVYEDFYFNATMSYKYYFIYLILTYTFLYLTRRVVFIDKRLQ